MEVKTSWLVVVVNLEPCEANCKVVYGKHVQ